MKQRYIRVDYSAEAELEQMSASRSLAGKEKFLTVTLRPGDFILAARYDHGRQMGEVRRVGQVQAVDGRLVIEWKSARFSVQPSEQGRIQWNSRPSFKFDNSVAARYNLEAECQRLFPGAPSTATRSAQDSSRPSGDSTSPATDPGYIYVIKSQYGYKIGKSRNLQDRTRLFSVKLPFPISVEMSGWSASYSSKERELHRRFAHKRLEGEWFDLSIEDLGVLRKELGTEEAARGGAL